MKIGLVGPSYQEFSLPFDAQRSVNLFPVFDDMGKEVAALYGTPGRTRFSTCGTGPVRAMFASSNGRAFLVSGNTLYEVFTDGTSTSRGTLATSSGNVSFDENPTQLGICDGSALYILTYATNAYSQVTDPDLPSAGTLTFIDGYFVINRNNTGQFYISALNNGTSWAALDFATAESSPDALLRVYNAIGQLWLFGVTTTEIWTNTGDSAFPFQRISGAKFEMGILAPHTALTVGDTIYWVGRDKRGVGQVYRAAGFRPKLISTPAIDKLIQAATDPTTMQSYTYQEMGRTFYAITGGGLQTTLVYDLTTEFWHERALLDEDGQYQQDIAYAHMFAFNQHLVGDRRNGNVYVQSMDYFSDDGNEIVRDRIYTHLSDEGKRIVYDNLEIGVEAGVGLQSGQGSNPLISLRLSRDGARTWSDWYTKPMGRVGRYSTKVQFRRLGLAKQMTFNIRITDPVKVAITGSYLNVAG